MRKQLAQGEAGASAPARPILAKQETPKMRVRMVSRIQSTDLGLLLPGQVIELEEGLAKRWIVLGWVELDKMLDGAPEVK